MDTNKILLWLEDFKYTWLPQNIPNDTRLIGSITNKLDELKHILNQNNLDENGLSITDEYPCDKSSDVEQVIYPTQQAPEVSLPTPPDLNNHVNDQMNHQEKLSRPAIRLKRIPLVEAERFMPAAWKPPKLKRGRKKGQKNISTIKSNAKKNKVLVPLTEDGTKNNVRKSTRTTKKNQHQSTTSLTSVQSTNGEKKKSKRKLRAIDAEDDDLFTLGNLSSNNHANGDVNCEQISRYIGQNGILSQTRKTNETTTFDDDFTIKLQSRKLTKEDISVTTLSQNLNDTNMMTMIADTPIVETMNMLDDGDTMDAEQILRDMIEDNDNDSLFTSLDITRDKTHESTSSLNNNSIINYNDCIEDISTDGIDPPPSSSSPSLAHLPLTTSR